MIFDSYFTKSIYMLGFSQKEQNTLIFLLLCFFVGLSIKFYQQKWASLPVAAGENMDYLNQMKPVPIREITSQKKSPPNSIVSLNTADFTELQKLPGVGPVIAKRIVDFREENGKFNSVEDLLGIQGVGAKKLEKIRPFLNCN